MQTVRLASYPVDYFTFIIHPPMNEAIVARLRGMSMKDLNCGLNFIIHDRVVRIL